VKKKTKCCLTTNYNHISLGSTDERTHTLTGIHSVRSGYLADDQWVALNYLSQNLAGETQISVSNLMRTSGAENGGESDRIWQRTLEGSFSVQAPETGNKPVHVSIDEMFSTPSANTCYLTGILSIKAGDGSKLILNADNGDSDSFQLELYDGETTQAFSVDWNTENALIQLTTAAELPSGLPVDQNHTSPAICQ